jgi:uncharacterized protein YcbX
MERIGGVETICRYPVRSMASEDVAQAFVGFAGLMGDRVGKSLDAGDFHLFTDNDLRRLPFR